MDEKKLEQNILKGVKNLLTEQKTDILGSVDEKFINFETSVDERLAKQKEGILTAVESGFEHVLERMDAMEEKMATKDQVENLNNRMIKVEVRLDSLEDEVKEVRKYQVEEFGSLDNRVKALEE